MTGPVSLEFPSAVHREGRGAVRIETEAGSIWLRLGFLEGPRPEGWTSIEMPPGKARLLGEGLLRLADSLEAKT